MSDQKQDLVVISDRLANKYPELVQKTNEVVSTLLKLKEHFAESKNIFVKLAGATFIAGTLSLMKVVMKQAEKEMK